MGTVTLTDTEKAVLAAINKLCEADAEGAYNSFHADVIEAAGGDVDVAAAVCSALRRRKLLEGQGRGKWDASYWISDKGKAALDG